MQSHNLQTDYKLRDKKSQGKSPLDKILTLYSFLPSSTALSRLSAISRGATPLKFSKAIYPVVGFDSNQLERFKKLKFWLFAQEEGRATTRQVSTREPPGIFTLVRFPKAGGLGYAPTPWLGKNLFDKPVEVLSRGGE